MLRRILAALGLAKKETVPAPKSQRSQMDRLQRASAFTAVNLDELRARRRGLPPR